ncbi:MAG: discoidin domain-containing protein, partial [Lentisphaeria bacterium]|nr:discoidin domain-containing protein [Lentisphaeria bacterium]
RRKPGNLAYQEFEGDGVVVTASSNAAGKYRRPDNALWHVVDGVVDTTDRYKALTWQDTTENQAPDWVAIKLVKAQAVGRVVVYPLEQSLKDYSVQVFIEGAWKDIASARGQKAGKLTHSFEPVNTDRVRLLITATHGPIAKVAEMEVYAQ